MMELFFKNCKKNFGKKSPLQMFDMVPSVLQNWLYKVANQITRMM